MPKSPVILRRNIWYFREFGLPQCSNRKKLVKAKLMDRVELFCGDAMNLTFGDNFFNGAFMSFTLELFDTP